MYLKEQVNQKSEKNTFAKTLHSVQLAENFNNILALELHQAKSLLRND